jgi:penicillin-binding protein 1C
LRHKGGEAARTGLETRPDSTCSAALQQPLGAQAPPGVAYSMPCSIWRLTGKLYGAMQGFGVSRKRQGNDAASSRKIARGGNVKLWNRFPVRVSVAALIVAVILGGCGWILVFQPIPEIPSFGKVQSTYVKSEGILLDRNGEVIHELRIHRQGRRLDWTTLVNISPALQSAVLEAEDRRFYTHGGVDWTSVGASLADLFRERHARGASTITMQLAAMQDQSLKPTDSRRSFFQKLRQMRAARGYEKRWSKAEILETYLNLVTFRGELQGVGAAARGLFSKEPQGINHVESVILAALLRAPNAPSNTVAERAYTLAQSLHLAMSRAEVEAAAIEALGKPYYIRPQVSLAPHIALQLFNEARSRGEFAETIHCTLDRRLQHFVAETLSRHVLGAGSTNMHDGAALVVDNRSGEVLAYVGNIGAQSSARYVDGIRASRQAGSTLKPFVYGLAFERRLLTPASLIDDSPLDISSPGGVYRPRNYDNQFRGFVTARMALASSLNVPAVKVLNLVGTDILVERLRRLGFDNIRTAEFYGPSLALGSADIALWDLVNAYRAIANGGGWSPLRLAFREPMGPQRAAMSAEASFLIADILSDRESRSLTFELESPLSTRFWTAVKTGTSKDMRDNWCVGFSEHYTVGVWAGNFSGDPMWNVSGITGAAPVWVEIMNQLHSREPSRRPQPPRGIIRRFVDIPSISQARQEWFISGTETTLVQRADSQAVPRIAYPKAGTIVALDPDIPSEAQRLFFEAEPEGTTLEWILDGQSLGAAAALVPWAPLKGKHVLKVLDARGKELDSVDFEVRGNPVPP